MNLWNEGKYNELISEAEICNKKLPNSQSKMSEEKALNIFTRLLLSGKIREAVRFITERQESGGVMMPYEDAVKPAGKTVLEVLQLKHPEQAEPHPDAFVECEELPTMLEVTITEEHIRKTAHKLSGSAGPSGADSTLWQSMLLRYGNHSKDLREAMAVLVERQANNIIEWEEVRAQKAKRELALRKLPAGIRPIGVGELMDRCADKTMIYVTEDDVKIACNIDQLCSGIKSGMEGAIHAIRQLFQNRSDDGYGLLLMDAANAFNSISRSAALWNARVLWTSCSRFLFNSYRGYALLIVKGTAVSLLSKEGVTQGVPSAMKLYAIGLLPLTQKLKDTSDFVKQEWEIFQNEVDCLLDTYIDVESFRDEQSPNWSQFWYADDASCISHLYLVLFWMKLLIREGPKFGYYPEPDKSYVVVASKFMEKANILFSPYGISVVEGSRVLGGFVGNQSETYEWGKNKVEAWVKSIQILSDVALKQPQAAYVAVSKSLQNEWSYLQRVLPECEELFSPLRQSLLNEFFPALAGTPINDLEFSILEKPTRMAGLGIRDPVASSKHCYETSKAATKILSESMVEGTDVNVDSYEQNLKQVTNEMKQIKAVEDSNNIAELIKKMPESKQIKLNRILENKCSTWLSVYPTQENFFAMSPDEFRDALALRYLLTPKNLPNICDGCGEEFNLCHALNCKKGGLVSARHNEMRDLNCDLCSLAGMTQIISEPVIQEGNDKELKGLRADWSVRGFWDSQRTALFDTCIFNADANSYKNQSLEALFDQKKRTKKDKYSKAAAERRASFTPFIATCEAIFDREAETYIKRLATILSKKWKSSYSQAITYIRARMQVCILRSVSLCIRGSRNPWRGAGFVDAAAFPPNILDFE